MAYNFTAIQRISDGKYLLATGEFGTLDFTSNYTNARFYYSDADDAANYLSSYAGGDYRIIEYWIPGAPASNKPKSNSTILNNIQGSLSSANAVTSDSVDYRGSLDRIVVRDETQYSEFQSAWNANGGLNGYLLFTQDQVNNLALQGAQEAAVFGLGDAFSDFFAVNIRSTNQSPNSGGYRRIVMNGAFFEAPFTGEAIQWTFATR